MADLTFVVEFIASIAAVVVPIGLIVAWLADGDYPITDLFIAPSWEDRGHDPVATHEEAAPRWRLERLRPRGEDPGQPGNAGRDDAGTAHSTVRSFTFDPFDC